MKDKQFTKHTAPQVDRGSVIAKVIKSRPPECEPQTVILSWQHLQRTLERLSGEELDGAGALLGIPRCNAWPDNAYRVALFKFLKEGIKP